MNSMGTCGNTTLMPLGAWLEFLADPAIPPNTIAMFASPFAAAAALLRLIMKKRSIRLYSA